MSNVARTAILTVLSIAAFVVLMMFLSVVLKIAVIAALFAFAYYWIVRANEARRRGKNWR